MRIILLLSAVTAFAQDPAQVTPYQLLDARSGQAVACSGCAIWSYAAGTTTKIATFTDSTLTVANTNPVLTNSSGYAVNGSTITGIWVGSACYKFVAKDANGATLWTQDHVCDQAQLLKALLATSAGAGLIGYSDSSSYVAATLGIRAQQQPVSVKDAPYGATGNGTVDDTTAVTNALMAASGNGQTLYFPTGTYAVSSVSVNVSGPVSILCADPYGSQIKRVTSALQASTPLLSITGASSVTIMNCGWNEGGDGTNYTNAASTVYLASISGQVMIGNNFSTLAQSNAFLVSGANDVHFTGNTCSSFWNSCLALSGTGSVGSPVYVNRVVIANNTCSHGAFCALVSVFVRDVTITGNVGHGSTIGIVQAVFESTLTGNEMDGPVDYGLGAVTPSSYPSYFIEGVEQLTMTGNTSNSSGAQGIYVLGSQLTVGTTEQLASQKITISANRIDSAASTGIYFKGASFDSSVAGKQSSIKGNTITNGSAGITATGTDSIDITDNHEDNLQVGGDVLAAVTNFRYEGNLLHNVGVAVTNSYKGLDITGATLTGYVGNNQIVSDGGNTLFACIDDEQYAGGTATQIQLAPDNVLTGCGSRTLPASIAPVSGSWPAGAVMSSFTTTTGSPLGWINTSSSGTGAWRTAGVLGNSGIPAVSACGSGPTLAGGSTNNIGAVGVNGASACTLTFSQAYSSAPFCTLAWTHPTITSYISAVTSTLLTVGFTGSISGQFFYYDCH